MDSKDETREQGLKPQLSGVHDNVSCVLGGCSEFCDCKCHKPEPTRAPESAEVDVIDTGLAGAVRQYRHNNGDGFVMGYDRNVVHEVIGRLESYTKDCNRDLGKVYDENQALTKERDDALAEVERLKDENEQLGYELKEAANS